MRRLGRHLSTFCSAVSLLLFVSVCVLWVRSYIGMDIFFSPTGYAVTPEYVRTTGTSVSLSRGRIFWKRATQDYPTPYERAVREGHNLNDGFRHVFHKGSRFSPEGWARFGLHAGSRTTVRPAARTDTLTESSVWLIVPLWLFAIVTATPAVAWFVKYRRRRWRVLVGLCPTCGYDYRASPERCPECGTSTITAAV
jgi:hypothetical protein